MKNVLKKERLGRRGWMIMVLMMLVMAGFGQNSRDTTKASRIINVNYLELFFGELRVTLEKPIKHNMSWEYGGGIIYYYNGLQMINYWENGPDWDPFLPYLLGGIELRGGLRIYAEREKNHEGFYIHPNCFVKYAYHYEVYLGHPESYNLQTLGLNFLFGYKDGKRISADTYFGMGGRLIYSNFGNFDPGYDKWFTPQLGFTIGYKLNKK